MITEINRSTEILSQHTPTSSDSKPNKLQEIPNMQRFRVKAVNAYEQEHFGPFIQRLKNENI